MADLLPRLTIYLLLAVHVFLVVWALVGLIEFFSANVPWPRISNPLFSDAMLLTQWLLVLPVALLFLCGFAFSWPQMPALLAVGYALMAAVCAFQTFTILENDSRFVAMAAEYAAYVAILIFLFRSETVAARLAGA